LWPSWEAFWAQLPSADAPQVAAPAPLEAFLTTMRGSAAMPKIRIR
jgi:hypothetical protein